MKKLLGKSGQCGLYHLKAGTTRERGLILSKMEEEIKNERKIVEYLTDMFGTYL